MAIVIGHSQTKYLSEYLLKDSFSVFSYPGYTARQFMKETIVFDVVPYFSVVVIMVGANDIASKSPEAVVADIRNFCETLHNESPSLAKLRNVVGRAPGVTFFIVSLIALCMTVPNVNVTPNRIYVPARSFQSESFGKVISTNAGENVSNNVFKNNKGQQVQAGNYGLDAPQNETARLMHDLVEQITDIKLERDMLEKNTDIIEKNTDMFEKNTYITEYDTDMTKKNTDMTEGNKAVIEKNIDVIEKNTDIFEKNTGGVEKNTDTFEWNTDVIKKNTDMFKRNTDVVENNADMTEKNTDMIEGNKDVIKKNSVIMEKNTDMIEKNTNVIGKNIDTIEKNTDLAEKNTDMNRKNTNMIEKNTDMIEKNTDLAEKDTDMIRKNSNTIEKNTEITEENTEIAEKNTIRSQEKGNRYLTERGQRKYEMIGREDMLEADRKCKRTLPDAIIIGVMKAGTEAFSTFLAINPQIAMSLNVRSTLFFTSRYHKGLAWYQHQMTCKTENQKTIEKAPQYFTHSLAPKRIYEMNKHIKLILLVRNPIDRAVSHYLQVRNSHPAEIRGRSFEDMVFANNGAIIPGKYINVSKYSTILRRWLKYFNLSQILILDGDAFKNDQIQVLSKAESFLGIEHYITDDKFVYDKEKGFYCLKGKSSPVCMGSGKGREHPTLNRTNYQKLRSYFKPYNEEFFRMVRQRFDW